MDTTPALLVLEDGTVFHGTSFGMSGEVTGEVVFNTSLTGYQEVLTDPSYKGQMVTMTYPLIGNYGVNDDDDESADVYLEAFIVKEASRRVSNWRATLSLPDYLKKHKVIGIEGIDTRALTKRIRQHGSMKAIISTTDLHEQSLREKVCAAADIVGIDLVKHVTCKKSYEWVKDRAGKERKGTYHVVVIDGGLKYNILRELVEHDCHVTAVPASMPAENILALRPDGIMVSNGPGDPAAVPYLFTTLRTLIGTVPFFGICLGHQMFGLALGAKTYKLKFGHHGGNQPVKDLCTGTIAITVQNHNFCIDPATLPQADIDVTHINLNDQTVEGIAHKKAPAFSVQFHPESAPGPNDAKYLFKKFVDMIKVGSRK